VHCVPKKKIHLDGYAIGSALACNDCRGSFRLFLTYTLQNEQYWILRPGYNNEPKHQFSATSTQAPLLLGLRSRKGKPTL